MNTRNLTTCFLMTVAVFFSTSIFCPESASAQHGAWLEGDFNADGLRDSRDINELTNSGNLESGYWTASAPQHSIYDMNFDGLVNTSDIAHWLNLGAVQWDNQRHTLTFYPPTVMGDTDLDGVVEKEDGLKLTASMLRQQTSPGQPNEGNYTDGDFNGDGKFDLNDWTIWNKAISKTE